MENDNAVASKWMKGVSAFAVLFGAATIKAGGSVLFSEEARQAAGNYVPFVVWFNFIAGFAYIATGAAIWKSAPWAGKASAGIAVATLAVFIAFGASVFMGGAYELRTVIAMAFRTGFWAVVTYALCVRGGQCRLKRG